MTIDVQKIQSLFLKLTAQRPEDWPQLLDQECAGQPELRAKLEGLLQAFSQPDSFFDQTYGNLAATQLTPMPSQPAVVQSSSPASTMDVTPTGPDVLIGQRYRLVEKIGEGGMGEVWVARQSTPVKRTVAIKLIKAGMDSKSVLARFEAERQALAIMDHPNIAKVLDGGVMPSGQPFFVMESVKGIPITDFCDRLKLSPEKRLELFVPVCHAIQHAHQKGIIHRDIKPSNVIVAMFDDVPIPKVIDFGIAKATGGGLTDQTIHTMFGGVVGTPQYMSPEQATLNNLDIDTRSDVYSLGVLLYELLAGGPPFSQQELEQKGVLEILRVVREEEPLRPSAKLSSSHSLPTLSANRSTEPGRLTKLLRSELDWIVLRALEKERSRRYDSAQSFAADITRYLSGDQVFAHPPTISYRLRKLVRKNRGMLAAGGLVGVVMLLGLASTTWQLMRANREAARANDQMESARQARDEAESALVKGLLRPIGYSSGVINDAEETAYRDIASQESDRFKLLVFQSCLGSPEQASRVVPQMGYLVQACVGTSLDRYRRAIEICSQIISRKELDDRIRIAAVAALFELTDAQQVSLGEVHDPAQNSQEESDPLNQTKLVDFVEILLDMVQSSQGSQGTSFAAEELLRRASLDVELARRLIAMLGDPSSQEMWFASARKTVSQIKDGESTDSKAEALDNPLVKLWIGLVPLAFADDATQRVDSLCQLFEKVEALRSFTKCEVWTATTASGLCKGICKSLPDVDEKSFARASSVIYRVFDRGGTYAISDFLYDVKDELYKISERLTADESERWFELLTRHLGEGNSDYSVVGVALDVLGPKLEPDVAAKQFQSLTNRLASGKGPLTPILAADILQGIAGLSRSKDFSECEQAASIIIELYSKTEHYYACNSGWLAIAENAPKLSPAIQQRAVDAIQADLSRQILRSDGEFADPGVHQRALQAIGLADSTLEIETRVKELFSSWIRNGGRNSEQAGILAATLPKLSMELRHSLAQDFASSSNQLYVEGFFADCEEFVLLLVEQMEIDEQQTFVRTIEGKLGTLYSSKAASWFSWDNSSMPCGLLAPKIVSKWEHTLIAEKIDTWIRMLNEAPANAEYVAAQEASYKNADMIQALTGLAALMTAPQKTAFYQSAIAKRFWELETKSEIRSAIISDLSPELLREYWIHVTPNLTDELAKAWAFKAPEELEAEFIKLIGATDSVRSFATLMNIAKSARLNLSSQGSKAIALRANQLLQDEEGSWEIAQVIEYCNSPKTIAKLIERIDCVGTFRAAILLRLEQLAFPAEFKNGPSASGQWKAELHLQDLESRREHFRTLIDFIQWDSKRPQADRWYLGSRRSQ